MYRKFTIWWLLIFVSFLIFVQNGQTQIGEIRLLSECLVSGNYHNVKAADGYAYIATAYGFKVMDIANPSNPLEVVHVATEGLTVNLTVGDGHLFTCDALGGVSVYNIDNPENPVFLDMINTPGNARAVIPYGNYFYIAAENYGIQIVDYNDPYNLELVDIIYVGGEANNLAIYDHWLYITLGIAGLGVYDISDPTDPDFMINWNTLGGNAKSLHVYEQVDYLAMADLGNGLHIMDITFPWIPTWTNTIESDTMFAGGVCGGDDYGLFTYVDQHVSSFNFDGEVLDTLVVEECSSISSCNDYAFVCKQHNGFDILGCQQPGNLIRIADVQDSGQVAMLIVKDEIGYVATKDGGLAVLDVSDPWNPSLEYRIQSDMITQSLVFSPDSQYLYSSEFDEGIRIYSLDNPFEPELINLVPMQPDSGTGSFDISNGYLYVSFWGGILHIYDITDPSLPSLTNRIEMPDNFRGVVFAENGYRMYAVCGIGGIAIYTVYAPDSIVYEYTLDIFDEVNDMQTKDNYAYVAAFNDGLYVCDITNYAYIFKIDSLPAQNAAQQVSIINDDYIAFSDWDDGFAIVDITDPFDIQEVGRDQTPSTTWSTMFYDNIFYVCEQYDLLLYDIFDVVGVEKNLDPAPLTHVLLEPAYPNPFNAFTTIKFSLVEKTRVNLAIYNVKGEEVAVLEDSFLESGSHLRHLDAGNLSSGIYFANLNAGGDVFTQKITLIK